MSVELDRFRRALQDLLQLGRLDMSVRDADPVTMEVGEVVRAGTERQRQVRRSS